MHLLGINGSPRAGGNSDVLLDEALRAAAGCGARTEKIFLNALEYAPCQECESVAGDGICRVRDDMESVYSSVKKADAIILASPIFFGSLSAQTKMMIDRFQCAWMARQRSKDAEAKRSKACALISVQAGNRNDFFENARSIVRNWCATIDARYEGELFCAGVEEKGSVRSRPDCMRAAFELGRRLASIKTQP